MQLEMHGKISENRGLAKTLRLLPISTIRSYSCFYKDRDMAIKWLALSLSLSKHLRCLWFDSRIGGRLSCLKCFVLHLSLAIRVLGQQIKTGYNCFL